MIFLVGDSFLNVAYATTKTEAVEPFSSWEIPAHPDSANTTVSPSEVNVNALRTTEPAPMGLADYGIGSSGAYEYSTSSFQGIVQIFSLSTLNATDATTMSFQLNAVLYFTTQTGGQFSYWIQDIAEYNTTNKAIFFEDNVWNLSSTTAEISASGISGSGQISTDANGTGFYGDVASQYYSYLTLPVTLHFEVNSSLNSQNEPQVLFSYMDGSSWDTFDTVTFPAPSSAALDSGFLVDGKTYDPYGTFYDAELILGGDSNGGNTTNLQSNVDLQLQYWNGNNYQEIYNAYNFGSDTAEGISNTKSESYYFSDNGSIDADVTTGSGTLGSLYQQSQVAFLSVQSNLTSGTLYLSNGTGSGIGGVGYPFTGDVVNVTITPGSYEIYLYDSDDVRVAEGNETASPGGNLRLEATSNSQIEFASQIDLTVSYSAVGGDLTTNPTITYISHGDEITANLSNTPTVILVDPGSEWNVSNGIESSSQYEMWQTNEMTSGVAGVSMAINFVYYNQQEVSLNFVLVGGGFDNSSPQVTCEAFGASEEITASSTGSTNVWLDVGSAYSYASVLPGSTSTERWATSSGTGSGVLPPPGNALTDLSVDYFNQYPLTASVSIVGGGSAAIYLNYTAFASPTSTAVSSTPSQVWADAGSLYSFPGAVDGSTAGERWAIPASIGGIVDGSSSTNATYYHQFMITVSYSVLGGGTYSLPVLNGTSFGENFSSSLHSATSESWADQGSTWSLSNALNGSSSSVERWQSATSPLGGSMIAPVQVSPVYYHQYSTYFDYTTVGGEAQTAPTVNFYQFGSIQTTQGNASAWVDAGSIYNYSSLLSGSSSKERWASETAINGTANGSAVAAPVYYLQYLEYFGYSINGEGGNASSPVVNYTSFGFPTSVEAANGYTWADAGSNYSYPLLLNGSDSNERWIVSNATLSPETGYLSGSSSMDVSYNHQYLLNVASSSPGGGSFTPSSGWYDSGTTLNLVETANARWQAEGWIGSGTGSFSGSARNAVIQVESPIAESALFNPGLLLSVSGSGSVRYSDGQGAGAIQDGSSSELFVSPGTAVSVSAVPSSFLFSFSGWTGASNVSSPQSVISINSPATLNANFGYSFSSLGLIAIVSVVAAFTGFWILRKRGETPISSSSAAAPEADDSED